MREVGIDQGGKAPPASVFGIAALAIISCAIVYNALTQQRAIRADLPTTRIQVDGSMAATTIRLKYDPLVEEVQRQLRAGGFYKGAVDGVIGKRTRLAIEAYQKAMNLEVTGEPSGELAEHIRYTRQITEASLFTGTIEPDPDTAMRAQTKRVQVGLAELGYSPGEISGVLTIQTGAAIKSFERDRGLDETGEVTDELLRELNKLSGESQLELD